MFSIVIVCCGVFMLGDFLGFDRLGCWVVMPCLFCICLYLVGFCGFGVGGLLFGFVLCLLGCLVVCYFGRCTWVFDCDYWLFWRRLLPGVLLCGGIVD